MYYGINYAVIFRVCFDYFSMFCWKQLPLLPKFTQNKGSLLLFKMFFSQREKYTKKKLLTFFIPDQSRNERLLLSRSTWICPALRAAASLLLFCLWNWSINILLGFFITLPLHTAVSYTQSFNTFTMETQWLHPCPSERQLTDDLLS